MTDGPVADQPDFSKGVMLCVRPDTPERFAVDGGTPVEDIHCTLLYFGTIDEFDGPAAEQAKEVLGAEIASNHSPLEGEITGWTRFKAGDDGEPLVLLVDAPGLCEMRTKALMALRVALGETHQPKQNHDFMAHITLCYGPGEEEMAMAEGLVGQKVRFEALEFVWGEESSIFGLGSDGLEGAISESMGSDGLRLDTGTLVADAQEADGMPYDIVNDHPDCEGEKKTAVVKKGSGEVMGCHDSEEDAQNQIAALMAAEESSIDPLATFIAAPEERLATLDRFLSETATTVEATAIQSHDTPTSDKSWDGPANKARARSGEDKAYYSKIFAWSDPEGDPSVKETYKFVHHEVNEDGTPGAANLTACSAGIAVLNGGRGGTTIPAADVQGVYNHLAAHLRDGDKEAPELQASIEDGAEEMVAAAEFTALPVHHTEVNDRSGYSGDEVKVNTRSDESPAYYNKIYAWHDASQPPGNKTSYRFPHHEVSIDGTPGQANGPGVHASLMFIEDSGIPKDDYRGVYNHLAAHLKDAGIEVPDLGTDNASADDVLGAIAHLRSQNITFAQEEDVVEEAIEALEVLDIKGLDDAALIGEFMRRYLESLAEAKGEAFAPMPMPKDDEEHPDHPMPMPEDGEGDEGDGEDEEEPVMVGGSSYEWEGVLIPEGIPSGDGRMIENGALSWRQLPLPLMLQTVNAEGHSGAIICGSIQEIERLGNNIVGRGNFDSGPAGREARRLLSEGTMRGVSADIDSVVVDLRDDSGSEADIEGGPLDGGAMEVLVEGRLMGATLCPFPAFQEAFVQVLESDEQAEDLVLVASATQTGFAFQGEVWRVSQGMYPMVLNGTHDPITLKSTALVASAATQVEIPVNPPMEWFGLQDMDEPQPFTVYPDGRCYGLIAKFGSCHIGFRDRCVDVPRSMSNYRYFRNKNTLTADGALVATGPIFMDTVHPSLRLRASDAEAHYAHTGCAVADVALYENEFGIVAAGALRPDATPEQIRRLRGSDISPDWRSIEGRLELVGLLGVNVSGFITPALAASGATAESMGERPQPRARFNSVSGEIETLVAAGAVRECAHCGSKSMDSDILVKIAEMLSEHDAKLSELSAAIRPYRTEYVGRRLAELAAKVADIQEGES